MTRSRYQVLFLFSFVDLFFLGTSWKFFTGLSVPACPLRGGFLANGMEDHEQLHLTRRASNVCCGGDSLDRAVFIGNNMSTFAVDGKDCRVHEDVERVLKEFHKAGKPIGLCCIASVLAAKVLRGVEVTVGHEQEEGGKWPYAGTAEAIKALGAKHCVKEVTEAHVDKKNKVVTTPAFMCETELHHVHDGIGAMVKKVLELCAK